MNPQQLGQFMPIIVLILAMYFIVFLPQRKKDKQFKAMLASLSVNDDIVTIGGVVGKVVKIKDDTITIETGADKVKMNFQKWAVKEVVKNEVKE